MVTSCTPPAPAAACAAGPCERKKYQFTQAIAAIPAATTIHSLALIGSLRVPAPPRDLRATAERLIPPHPTLRTKFSVPPPPMSRVLQIRGDAGGTSTGSSHGCGGSLPTVVMGTVAP